MLNKYCSYIWKLWAPIESRGLLLGVLLHLGPVDESHVDVHDQVGVRQYATQIAGERGGPVEACSSVDLVVVLQQAPEDVRYGGVDIAVLVWVPHHHPVVASRNDMQRDRIGSPQ